MISLNKTTFSGHFVRNPTKLYHLGDINKLSYDSNSSLHENYSDFSNDDDECSKELKKNDSFESLTDYAKRSDILYIRLFGLIHNFKNNKSFYLKGVVVVKLPECRILMKN